MACAHGSLVLQCVGQQSGQAVFRLSASGANVVLFIVGSESPVSDTKVARLPRSLHVSSNVVLTYRVGPKR